MSAEGFPDEEEGPDGAREHIRTKFSIIALVALLLAASGSATLGGLVAAGIGGEPLERPDGFTFDAAPNGSTMELTIRVTGPDVPNSERVYVVDENGNRVPWPEIRTGDGVARVTGVDSDIACIQQGTTYLIVFEGRARSQTLAVHEITRQTPGTLVSNCQRAANQSDT
jgi:hypothetical protein